MKRIIALLPLCLVILACTACGPSNTVRLLYKPADASVLPPPGAPSVTIVQFDDKRNTPQLGVRRDNSSFMGTSPVTEWISRSLGDALSRKGVQVTYATTADQARSANPAYIITGEVEQAWLKETSTTEISATLRANMTLSRPKGRIFTETLSASQSRSGLPSSSRAEELLLDTVQELVVPAADKVYSTIHP